MQEITLKVKNYYNRTITKIEYNHRDFPVQNVNIKQGETLVLHINLPSNFLHPHPFSAWSYWFITFGGDYLASPMAVEVNKQYVTIIVSGNTLAWKPILKHQ